METSLSQNKSDAKHDPDSKPIFNVVIAYEDFAAGKHAKETYDYLVHQLGHDFEFNNQMWKFDVLSNLKMREMAVKDAAAADLIIISTHSVGELPREARSWIDGWSVQQGSAMALVTLAERPRNEEGVEANPLRTYLQRVARKSRMEFFSQPDDWSDKDEDFSSQQIHERAQRTSTLMADFLHHSASAMRWGINE